MTYCPPALATGLNGWTAPQCAASCAERRRELRGDKWLAQIKADFASPVQL